MSQTDAPRDASRDRLRDVPHTTPHHTTPISTSSRSMALALVVETLRPDWSASDIAKALAADDRPWRTVVLASIRGAAGTDVRHPNGLRYVNPDGVTATQLPPSLAEWRTAERCEQHGAVAYACALCRHGIEATP